MTSSMMMAGMYGIQAINAWSSAQDQARAIKAQGRYYKMMADTNARLSLMNAEDAIKRGDLAAGAARRKGSAVKGAQRVSAAAQGIDINSGSALDLQSETEQMSDNDVNTIKNNAWREAWGYRVQANQYEGQGRLAEINAKYGAKQTALTGGLQAIGYAAQGMYAYKSGQETDELFKGGGTMPDGEQAGSETLKKPEIGDSAKSKTGMGWHKDEGKDGPGFFGRGPRSEYGSQGWRTRENPFGGPPMTNSWWIRYDNEE